MSPAESETTSFVDWGHRPATIGVGGDPTERPALLIKAEERAKRDAQKRRDGNVAWEHWDYHHEMEPDLSVKLSCRRQRPRRWRSGSSLDCPPNRRKCRPRKSAFWPRSETADARATRAAALSSQASGEG